MEWDTSKSRLEKLRRQQLLKPTPQALRTLTTMPISKKSKIQREHKKADAAGTRAPVKANGLPVKAPKPTSICANCRKEMVSSNLKQLEVHAETHDQKLWTKEKCWPAEFPAAAEAS